MDATKAGASTNAASRATFIPAGGGVLKAAASRRAAGRPKPGWSTEMGSQPSRAHDVVPEALFRRDSSRGLPRELGRRLPPGRRERVVIRWGATLKRFGSLVSSSTYVLVRCDLVWLGVPYWRNRRTAPHYTDFLLHVLKSVPAATPAGQ